MLQKHSLPALICLAFCLFFCMSATASAANPPDYERAKAQLARLKESNPGANSWQACADAFREVYDNNPKWNLRVAALFRCGVALEEKANEQTDPFFKQAIMLIVDANDPDRVRSILENDIEQTSARHMEVVAMYERGSNAAPAFGMIGTLIGLINMLKNLDGADMSSLGPDMSVALVTTFYGSIMAHVIFNPIAANLTARDEEEILCRQIIVEGIMAIQSGENPKFLRERLMTFMNQKLREGEGGGSGGEGGGKRRGRGRKQ